MQKGFVRYWSLAAITLIFLFPCSVPAKTVPSQAGTELKLGFWNIRDFSANSRDRQELRMIAQVVTNLDCLAICEVNDVVVLGQLVEALNGQVGTWKAVQTKVKSGNTPSSQEYYGFVYRADKMAAKHKPSLLKEVACPLPEFNKTVRFDREPAECTFATLDARLDFTMMVVHITWGSKKPQKELVACREAEIRALKGYYEKTQAKETKDKDLILCGDFNVSVGDSPALATLLAIPTMIDTTAAAVPTKIDTANTYDHLLFQTSYLSEYTGTHGVIKFDEILFGNDDKLASRTCSDHRPVWIVLRVPEQDDD